MSQRRPVKSAGRSRVRPRAPASGSPGTTERRLRAIIEAEPECVKIVSREGRLLEMNAAGLAMLQAASLEEVQRQPLLDYIVPEHRAAFADLHRKVMQGQGGTLQFEVIGLHGARRWLETHAVPLRNDAGEVEELLGITRDVTERVLAERRAADEQRILELIARDAPLTDVLNALCKYIEAQFPDTSARCSILMLDDAGTHLRHVAAPGLPERYIEAIGAVAIGPQAGSCGTAAYRGEQIIVSNIGRDPLWRDHRDAALREGLHACWSTPIRSDKGKVLGTIAIYCTEPRSPSAPELRVIEGATSLAGIAIVRSHNDLALRESEGRFRELAENIREVFWLTNSSKSEMLYVSPAYEQIWGRSCESLYAAPRTWLDAIHPEDRERVLRAATERQARGEYDEEYRIVRPDGEIRWIRDRAFRVLDAAGAVHRIAGVAEDITARKHVEEQLRLKQKQLGELIESVDGIVWEADARTFRFTFVSPRAERLLGYPVSRWIEESSFWSDHILPEDRDHAVGYCAESTSQLRNHEFEYRMRAADGRTVWLRDIVTVVSEGRRPVKLRGVMVDITERKHAEQRLLESEAKYRALIEQASDGIFVIDAAGRFLLANSPACALLGYHESELLGINHEATYVEEERHLAAARVRMAQTGAVLRYERLVRRQDGSTFPAEFSSRMLDSGDFQIIFRDISERRNQELKIARLSRIQAVLSGINSAILRIRSRQELFDEACRIAVVHGGLTSGWIGMLDHASGRLVPVAQAGLPKGFGVREQVIEPGHGFLAWGAAEVALRDRRPAVDNDIEHAPADTRSDTATDTLSIRGEAIRLGARSAVVLPLFAEDKTFGILTLYAPERDFFDDEEVRLLTDLAGDVSFALDHMQKEEKLNYLAYYDALTGLANRTLLLDRLGHNLKAAERERSMTALILMDVERFHVINETVGRAVADDVLRELARRLQTVVRAEESLARVAGDRFAMTLEGIGDTTEVVHFLRDRIVRALRDPVMSEGRELRLSAKFGLALYPADGNSAELLYSNAETALKKAKVAGERFLFYAPEMNARVAETLALETRLRNALDQGQFVLYYQPKVSATDGRILGLEALIRWREPELGLVPPAKFIPLMEETGLILDAGRWVLSQVARDCAFWAQQGIAPVRAAANVSPLQLRQNDFVDMVAEAAEACRQAGSLLDLEITESVIMGSLEENTRKLLAIRDLGVHIAVDDFGTGYSSLAYIAKLPIHSLKIDRSFVAGLPELEGSLSIVKSIISLAHSLKLQVVAEGVETAGQAAQLAGLGCDQLQGYLISRPLPREALPEFMKVWRSGDGAEWRTGSAA